MTSIFIFKKRLFLCLLSK